MISIRKNAISRNQAVIAHLERLIGVDLGTTTDKIMLAYPDFSTCKRSIQMETNTIFKLAASSNFYTFRKGEMNFANPGVRANLRT